MIDGDEKSFRDFFVRNWLSILGNLDHVSNDLQVDEKEESSLRSYSADLETKDVQVCNTSTTTTEIVEESKEPPSQIIDREKIEKKITELPDGIRIILKEKFQADFVSIEKIDEIKLI